MKTLNIRLEVEKLDKVAHILKAVAHPVRIQVIDLLDQATELTVTEIYEKVGVEQSLISHHLTKMKDRGVLTTRRDGKNIYYSLTDRKITNIIDCIEKCNM